MKKTWPFLLLLLLPCKGLQAQNSVSMVAGDSAYWFPAAVTIGSTIAFPVKVKNNLATPYNDSVKIYMAVDTSNGIFPPVVFHYQGFGPVVSIAPLDTVTLSLINIYVNPLLFDEGNNTVVIWPIIINPGPPDPDSLTNETIAYNGINESPGFIYPVAYPNPTGGILTFSPLKQPLEEVRIYGHDGRFVQVAHQVTLLDISQLKAGIYYLQYEFEGRMIIKRIVKL